MLTRASLQKLCNKQTSARRGAHAVPASPPLASAIELMGAPMTFGRKGEIYGEDEPADYLYKVVSGAVTTSRVPADGRRQNGSFHLPGDVFGLEVGGEHAYSAEAITQTKVLVVRRSALIGLAGRDGDVAQQLWTFAAQELARVQGHILLLVKTAQERVADFLLEMAGRMPGDKALELPMSRRDIADYLGLTIETVSRTLTMLASDGAIELATSRCVKLRKRSASGRLHA